MGLRLAHSVLFLIAAVNAQRDPSILNTFRRGGLGSLRGRRGEHLSHSVPSRNSSTRSYMAVTTTVTKSLSRKSAEERMTIKIKRDHCCKSDLRLRDQVTNWTLGDRIYCNSTLVTKEAAQQLQGCVGVEEVLETRVSSSWIRCEDVACCHDCAENLTLSFQRPLSAPVKSTRISEKSVARKAQGQQVSSWESRKAESQQSSNFESKSCKISIGPNKKTFIIRRLDCGPQLVISTTDVRSGTSHDTDFKEGQCEVEQQVTFANLHHETIVFVKVAATITGRAMCTGNMTFESENLIEPIDCFKPPCYTSIKFWKNTSHKFGIPTWALIVIFSALFMLFLMGVGSLAAILSLAGKVTRAGAEVVFMIPKTPAGMAISGGMSRMKSWVTPTAVDGEPVVVARGNPKAGAVLQNPRWCATCGVFVTAMTCPTCGFLVGCGNSRIGVAAPISVCPTDGTECVTNFLSTIKVGKGDSSCIYFGQTDSKGATFHGNRAIRIQIEQIGYEATYTESYQTYDYKCAVEGKFRCQDAGRCSSDCSAVLRDPSGGISLTANDNVDANSFVAKLPGHASCLESSEDGVFECFKSSGCQYCKAGAYPTKGPIDVVEMKTLIPFICYDLLYYTANVDESDMITNATVWEHQFTSFKCDRLEGQALGSTLVKDGDFVISGKTNILTPQLMDKKHIALNYDRNQDASVLPSWAWLVKAADVNEEVERGVIGSVQNRVGQPWSPANTRLSHNLFERLQVSHRCEYACYPSGVGELTESHPDYLPTQYGSGRLHVGVVSPDQNLRVRHYIQVLLTADCDSECRNRNFGACVVSYLPVDESMVLPENFPCSKEMTKYNSEWKRGEVYKDPDGTCFIGFYTSCGNYFGGNNVPGPTYYTQTSFTPPTTVHVETKVCACGDRHWIYVDTETFNKRAKEGKMEPQSRVPKAPPELFITWIPDSTSVEAELTVESKASVKFFRQRSVPVVPAGQNVELTGCYNCDFPISVTFRAGSDPETTVAIVSSTCTNIDLLDQDVQLKPEVGPVTIRIKAKSEIVDCTLKVTAGQQSESLKIHGKLELKDLLKVNDSAQVVESGKGNTSPNLDVPWDLFDPNSWDGWFEKLLGGSLLSVMGLVSLGLCYCLITFCMPLLDFIKATRPKNKDT